MTIPTQVDPLDVGGIYEETGQTTADILARMESAINYVLQAPRRTVTVGRFTGLSKTGVGLVGVLDLRTAAGKNKIAVAFVPDYDGLLTQVYAELETNGVPIGSVWATIQGDASGKPNKVDYGTSNSQFVLAVAGGDQCYPFVFNPPIPVKAGQKVWVVLNGDYAVSAVNYVSWIGLFPVTVGDTTSTYDSTGAGTWATAVTTILVRAVIYEQIPAR